MVSIKKFSTQAGQVVEQDLNGLVGDVKEQFSKEQIQDLVKQSITKGIANCQLERDKKADQIQKRGSSLAADINEITKAIEGTLDCDALQLKVKKELASIKNAIEENTKEIQTQLERTLGIVKVPLNPFKIPKFIVKQTIGRVLPDLEATIDFIKRTVQLIQAITKLIATVEKVVDRLEACALSTVNLVTQFARNEIDEAINELKMSVSDAIADAICNGLKDAGVKANNLDDVFTAINTINNLKSELSVLKSTATAALGGSVASIGSKQADIQSLTGIPPVLDTSSLDNFLVTVDSPEYEQYKSSVAAVATLPEPVNQTLPVITGSATVGSTLTSSNGVWTANGVTNTFPLSFQWMKLGQEIFGANTYQYIPVIDDVDYPVYCRVRAENQVSIEEVFTANTAPVVFALAGGNVPVITGTAQNGQTLTCSEGTWPFTTTSVQYEWTRVVQPGANVRVQSLSGNNTYYCKTADIGNSIKCRVVVTSFRYSLSAESANTQIVIA
jgi:hypothetical protein